MDNSTTQTELIIRYLDGEMSGPERSEFEARLASDEGLKRELGNLALARDSIRTYGLKHQIEAVRKDMLAEQKPAAVKYMSATRRIVRYSVAAAASIILLAVCVLAYEFAILSPDNLYKEKYSPFELSTLRGGNALRVSRIERNYRDKNFQGVIALAAGGLASDTKDQFLAGASCLEMNQPNEAITYFSAVLKTNQDSVRAIYKDETEYYLALSYLKIGNYVRALELMKSIHENPTHLYHEKFTSGFIRKVKMLKLR